MKEILAPILKRKKRTFISLFQKTKKERKENRLKGAS